MSGSDETVRVWDAVWECGWVRWRGTGVRCRFLGRVRIVSGSGDKTVRVWDAVSGVRVGSAGGAHGLRRSVSFLGTGRASWSEDNTVRVWDAVSGECVLGPLEGTRIREVGVVSGDGSRIVSGPEGQDRAGVGRGVWGVRVGSAGGTGWVLRCRFWDGSRIVSRSSKDREGVGRVSGECVRVVEARPLFLQTFLWPKRVLP